MSFEGKGSALRTGEEAAPGAAWRLLVFETATLAQQASNFKGGYVLIDVQIHYTVDSCSER